MSTIDYIIEPSKEEGRNTIAIVDAEGVKKYIHSTIAPSREETSMKQIIEQNAQDTVLVLGCGLGYHLKPLADQNKVLKVIIIDILENIDFFLQDVPHIQEIHPVFITGTNTSLVETKLKENLDLDSGTKIFICEHPSSLRLFHSFYSECRSIIEKVIRLKTGNLITQKSFSSLFFRNSSKNIIQLGKCFPVSSLKNFSSGYPVIIVSSAPSVSAFIPQIKQNENFSLILCIDSALPILKAHNITPDFIISIDPQPWVMEHLLNADKMIPVICSLTSWPLFQHSRRFLSLNSHPICQIIDHYYPGIIGSIDSSTGTIAGDAINAAIYMGCSPIYTTGLDFSFPQHIIYDKNSAYHYRFSKVFNTRFKTPESLHLNYIRKSKTKAGEGGIATRQSFLQFRDAIGSHIKALNKQIINLKGRGLTLPNTVESNKIIITDTMVSKNQLINKLSTLSTIGSLIDILSLKTILSDKSLISNAVVSATGETNTKTVSSFVSTIAKQG